MSSVLGRVFSGIQPTGVPHLGNYFGAITQWLTIAKNKQVSVNKSCLQLNDKPIFCIVDVHAYTSSAAILGETLRNNTYSTLASLLATGLNLHNCILYLQSDVLEHFYLNNVLQNFIGSNRLNHMIQFKEKSSKLPKDSISNALLNYPVLQAADILLYKAKYVPVGEDQTQHIELTRDIARNFNNRFKQDYFPEPLVVHDESLFSKRIKSLRCPEKKMSKSDESKKSFIRIIDEPDIIIEKCKKAVTDTNSKVTFDAVQRPGVSNLIVIYHLISGLSVQEVVEQSSRLDTGRFKLKLAEAIIEKFAPIRSEYTRLINERQYLDQVLKQGQELAQPLAAQTVRDVKYLLGSP